MSRPKAVALGRWCKADAGPSAHCPTVRMGNRTPSAQVARADEAVTRRRFIAARTNHPIIARAGMSKCPVPIRRFGKNRRRQGEPMRYLLLIYGNEQAAAAKSPEAQAAEMDAWWKYTADLQQSGEQLGGYYLIDAPNLDAAIAWASKMPNLPGGGSVEIRPIMEFDTPAS